MGAGAHACAHAGVHGHGCADKNGAGPSLQRACTHTLLQVVACGNEAVRPSHQLGTPSNFQARCPRACARTHARMHAQRTAAPHHRWTAPCGSERARCGAGYQRSSRSRGSLSLPPCLFALARSLARYRACAVTRRHHTQRPRPATHHARGPSRQPLVGRGCLVPPAVDSSLAAPRAGGCREERGPRGWLGGAAANRLFRPRESEGLQCLRSEGQPLRVSCATGPVLPLIAPIAPRRGSCGSLRCAHAPSLGAARLARGLSLELGLGVQARPVRPVPWAVRGRGVVGGGPPGAGGGTDSARAHCCSAATRPLERHPQLLGQVPPLLAPRGQRAAQLLRR